LFRQLRAGTEVAEAATADVASVLSASELLDDEAAADADVTSELAASGQNVMSRLTSSS